MWSIYCIYPSCYVILLIWHLFSISEAWNIKKILISQRFSWKGLFSGFADVMVQGQWRMYCIYNSIPVTDNQYIVLCCVMGKKKKKKEYECPAVMIRPLCLECTHFLRIRGCPLSASSLLKVHYRLLLARLLRTAATSTLSARKPPNTAVSK